MKGIILAGGSGTRLHPSTLTISKQLLPVYDKPMIYYPISILMLARITEILVISTEQDLPNYKELLGDGSDLGIKFQYKVQPKPEGIAQAFILGEEFIGEDDVCLILGDNIFYCDSITKYLKKGVENAQTNGSATIFGYHVNDPENYGVVKFGPNKEIESFHEKPQNAPSNYAIVGLYFYPNSVIEIAKNIKPSQRGELEITSVNNEFLRRKKIHIELMGRGLAWLDTGTHKNLLQASNFIHNIQSMQAMKVACLEEVAFEVGLIDENKLRSLIGNMASEEHSHYLKNLLKNE